MDAPQRLFLGRHTNARREVATALIAVVIGVVACGGNSATPARTQVARPGGATSTVPGATSGIPITIQAPLPAGPLPSAVSKMVCSKEAQDLISSVLGIIAHVSQPIWEDHLYSCGYSYPSGTLVLSVKELSSVAETSAYFDGLAQKRGNQESLPNLGQGAFTTSNGSVVVRKDYKVLVVDISGLSGSTGRPPYTPSQVANTVADIIMQCWAGD